MARIRKGKGKSGTYIEREMFMSRAFHSLTGFAPQLLILFLGKRTIKLENGKYVCINLDSLTMTYVELENIYNRGNQRKHIPVDGISRPRITRALDDLLAKGFIKIINHGGAYKQDKTIYALTNDWILWQPGQVIYKRPKDTRWRGYRKPKIKVTNETVPIHTNETIPLRT